MYTIFRNFHPQYSRRLLSILAQHIKNKKTINRVGHSALIVFKCTESLLTTFCKLKIIWNSDYKNKKMRSTHTCTPTFVHSLLNIHVGCCLFSHKFKKSHIKNKSGCRFITLALYVWGTTIYFAQRLYEKRSEKKMRSTHACTPSSRLFFTIFTSVVVYSRTTKVIIKILI